MDAQEPQGASLGLPPSGPGSVGSLLRRLVALIIDWTLCQLIAIGLLSMTWGEVAGAEAFLPLLVFFVENLILVATLGTTVGHRLLGLRVVGLGRNGAPPTLLRSAIRAGLLCLVVPALVMDGNGRGLHDKAAGSIVVHAR